ncbi:MAG: Gx transporter family protein, partial [Clostridia bacterium]
PVAPPIYQYMMGGPSIIVVWRPFCGKLAIYEKNLAHFKKKCYAMYRILLSYLGGIMNNHRKFFKKTDLLLIGGLCVLALILLLVVTLSSPKGTTAQIYLHDVCVMTCDLSEDSIFQIDQAPEVTFQIQDENRFYPRIVGPGPCSDRLINAGQTAVCLPHRLVVRIHPDCPLISTLYRLKGIVPCPICSACYLGILFALAITLSWAESLIPPLPFLPPGVKLGLSNVVTMYCLFCIGWKEAFLIALLKGAFAFVTRGATAGFLSSAGGILSVLALLLCVRIFKQRVSYTALSITGATCHNLGQLLVASFLVDTPLYLFYLPVLLLSGIFMGACQLRTVLPFYKHRPDQREVSP